MVMWLSLLGFLINPLNICLRRGRISFLFAMVRILLAPFTVVYFVDVWFAGQLNSTVAVLLDMQYYLCYIISDPWKEGANNEEICTGSGNGIRPILSCLPALWRFFQCLRLFYGTKQVRHLIHSGKYATTFPIVVFVTLFADKVTPNFSVFSLTDLDLQVFFCGSLFAGLCLCLSTLCTHLNGMFTVTGDCCSYQRALC